MRVLVVGQGGREHALVKALKAAPSVEAVHAAPGSDGIALDAACHAWDGADFDALIAIARAAEVDLAVIGPENPLAEGAADRLREEIEAAGWEARDVADGFELVPK